MVHMYMSFSAQAITMHYLANQSGLRCYPARFTLLKILLHYLASQSGLRCYPARFTLLKIFQQNNTEPRTTWH